MKELRKAREAFERHLPSRYETAVLTFTGVDGRDVYNCSAPFRLGGIKHLYGRVERREVWADSAVYLFRETEKDCFTPVADSRLYPLEDPAVCLWEDQLLLCGTHVEKERGAIAACSAYFFRGTTARAAAPEYFTTGPRGMKDIRLVKLPEGFGVFTRPGNTVGYTVLRTLEELSPAVLEAAADTGLVEPTGHGGVNQCFLLEGGCIGLIGHEAYATRPAGVPEGADWYSLRHSYVATAAVYDPAENRVRQSRILATASCFRTAARKVTPAGQPMDDVVFPSGILWRPDGRIDLYAGVGDATEQRLTLDDPFAAWGYRPAAWEKDKKQD